MVFLFVGLELVSIPTYLLLYLPATQRGRRSEAATKYFFLSIFSSALLLFGLAYLLRPDGRERTSRRSRTWLARGRRTRHSGGRDPLFGPDRASSS